MFTFLYFDGNNILKFVGINLSVGSWECFIVMSTTAGTLMSLIQNTMSH